MVIPCLILGLVAGVTGYFLGRAIDDWAEVRSERKQIINEAINAMDRLSAKVIAARLTLSKTITFDTDEVSKLADMGRTAWFALQGFRMRKGR